MSSYPNSTLTLPQAQQALRQATIDLRNLDHRIGWIAGAVEPHPNNDLPAAFSGTLQAIRSDRLADAIATLWTLATLSDHGDAVEQIRLAESMDYLASRR